MFSTPDQSKCGRGNAVGRGIGYGLGGPGIESRWGRDFSHLSRLALGPTHSTVEIYKKKRPEVTINTVFSPFEGTRGGGV